MIKRTNNVLEILDLIKLVADKDTIVLFYPCEVLFTLSALCNAGRIEDALQRYYGNDEQFYANIYRLKTLILLQSNFIPVDNNMQELIKYLEENKIKSFVLDQFDSKYTIKYSNEYCNQFQTWNEWIYENLKKIGIDFEKLSLLEESFELTYDNDDDECYFNMYKGIMCTNSALDIALEKLSYKPSKVIFIASQYDHHDIANVEGYCNENSIEFYGCDYTKIDVRTDLLVKTLIETGKWLNDSEVDEMMTEYF